MSSSYNMAVASNGNVSDGSHCIQMFEVAVLNGCTVSIPVANGDAYPKLTSREDTTIVVPPPATGTCMVPPLNATILCPSGAV